MKRLTILVAIGFSLIALSMFTTVFATNYLIGSAVAAPNANIWRFTPISFAPSDVEINSIEATCWDASTTYTVVPKKVLLTKTEVILIFASNDLPSTATGFKITGSLTSPVGDTFEATGPGFAFRRTR